MLLYRYRDIYESAGVPIPWKPQSLPKQIRELLSYGNAEAAALEVGCYPTSALGLRARLRESLGFWVCRFEALLGCVDLEACWTQVECPR